MLEKLISANKKIFNLWLVCYSQEEIAKACECSKATVNEICSEMAILPKSNKPAADHLIDFDIPIYNV